MTNDKSLLERICPFRACHNKILLGMIFGSLLLALTLPLANAIFVYPAFEDVIIKGIESDAMRLARHLSPASLKHSELTRSRMTDTFFAEIYRLEYAFGLTKVRFYAPDGEILYSTNPREMGQINNTPYFREIVSTGTPFSKLISQESITLKGDRIEHDIVESYVPYMNGARFLGAFEMYFDITKRMTRLRGLVFCSSLAMFTLGGFLLLAMIMLIRIQARHLVEQEQAQELREEVDRIARHDIKTPIAGILSGLEYIQHFTHLDAEQSEIAASMRQAANSALEMISRGLELYRMETGIYEYNPKEVDILGTAQICANNLASLADSKQVRILVTLDGRPPAPGRQCHFPAEDPLLYSMLGNLLKNAIEASPENNRVTLGIRKSRSELQLKIHNFGTVPESVRTAFFDKYATAEKSGGTGLGTYSARLMARTMGGDITMSTSEEEGTMLVVTLPQPNPLDIPSAS
ncbi:sensor histidine kinase [Pseudodesulfovibrio tunisiensis]|uniref:sensor histidine kinase n=1 Tax=Pseudodesulfovibrio tunisiensis TaxID=463192 RepID=UPI001FB48B9B|nr:HAMP domain-containing sensor histidine kinase [Pseudodesulfovibrio tunisiensis]